MAAFLPSTRAGRLACWLAVAFLAWWFANQAVYVASINGVEPTGTFRAVLIALSWLGMATGIAALGVGAYALLRQGERGIAVFLCLVPGLFALAFVLGELLLPH